MLLTSLGSVPVPVPRYLPGCHIHFGGWYSVVVDSTSLQFVFNCNCVPKSGLYFSILLDEQWLPSRHMKDILRVHLMAGMMVMICRSLYFVISCCVVVCILSLLTKAGEKTFSFPCDNNCTLCAFLSFVCSACLFFAGWLI